MKARRLISPAVRRMEVERFDPGPVPDDGILVRNDFTAVSVGTEIWNWLHGAEPGREPVFPRTTGYCNCGTVLAVGSQVTDVQPGERVAGQGNHASHSILRKPYNRVPDDVPSQHAVLLTMAAIALHGIRVGLPHGRPTGAPHGTSGGRGFAARNGGLRLHAGCPPAGSQHSGRIPSGYAPAGPHLLSLEQGAGPGPASAIDGGEPAARGRPHHPHGPAGRVPVGLYHAGRQSSRCAGRPL